MSEERTNMAIRDLKHYVIDNMSLDVQDDFEIICKYITNLQKKVEQQEKEIERLNNIINELENTIANFIDNHTESYIDWKYDREIYLAESNVLQKLFDNYLDKLKELKDSD